MYSSIVAFGPLEKVDLPPFISFNNSRCSAAFRCVRNHAAGSANSVAGCTAYLNFFITLGVVLLLECGYLLPLFRLRSLTCARLRGKALCESKPSFNLIRSTICPFCMLPSFQPNSVRRMTIVFRFHRRLVFKNAKLLFFLRLSRSCRRVIGPSCSQAREARCLAHARAVTLLKAASIREILCISGAQSEQQ